MARIELWNGDICDLEVDAIVNPANLSLWMATGVGGAIKRAGGDAIEFAAVRQAPVPARRGHRDDRPARSPPAPSSTPSRSTATGARAAQVIDAAARSAMARAREIGAHEHRVPGARHRRRRVPARRGGADHGRDRPRRAGRLAGHRARHLRAPRRRRLRGVRGRPHAPTGTRSAEPSRARPAGRRDAGRSSRPRSSATSSSSRSPARSSCAA